MIQVSEKDFDAQIAKGVVVVMFGAPWCGQCKMTVPVLNQIEGEIKNAKFLTVNSQEDENLAIKFGVSGLPTIVVLKNGKEFGRLSGMKPKSLIAAEINKAL